MSESGVTVDDTSVQRRLSDGTVERVAWAHLVEVSIMTTDEGPLNEDVYIALAAADGSGCLIPQGAPESQALLERLQKLPGFDNERFIQAMQSTSRARFVCWRRP